MKTVPVFTPYFNGEEEKQIAQVLASGWVAQGPKVAEFEKMVAQHEGVAHGVATTSCTTALHLAMVAMGLSAGDDILIPSFTFVATPNAAEMVGATAVFVDVETETFNIDISSLNKCLEENYEPQNGGAVNKKTGNRLFGLVPVHLFGLCANMPEVNKIATQWGFKVLEDSACALGAHINGTHQGAFGNPSALSFHARKSITTGEGGMVLTDDDALAKRMAALRSHAASASEIERHQNRSFLMPQHNELGYNYRMTDVQGAMGVAQMMKLDEIIEKKRACAAAYDEQLPLAAPALNLPTAAEGYFHTYQSYVVTVNLEKLGAKTVEDGNRWRNSFMGYLEDNGVSTRQGTHACHMLGAYAGKYGYKPQDLPGAYACDQLSIAIPLYAGLTQEDQSYVIDVIKKAVQAVTL